MLKCCQLKQEFAEEDVQEQIKRMKEELQVTHEAELSTLRKDLERETEKKRTCLEKALQEEKEKLKSLQAALDNNESKINCQIQKENNIHIDMLIKCQFVIASKQSDRY